MMNWLKNKYDATDGYIYARCVGLVFGDGQWKGWGDLYTTRLCPSKTKFIVINRLLDNAGLLGERERTFKRTDRLDDPFLIFEECPPHEVYNAQHGNFDQKINTDEIWYPSSSN